jgi:hypothetical protein
MLVQTMQASALLTCVREQCPTATPTNAVRVPRYPSIAIPRVIPKNLHCLPPQIAQALTECTGRRIGMCIVHGKLMVEGLSYSMVQAFKRCQVEIELFHTTR